jgi:serine/threonine-protein kinase
VLFTANTGVGRWDRANIKILSLKDHRQKTIQQGGTFGRYMATSSGAGYLSYVNGGALFAVPFDLDVLAVRGTPAPVLEDVAYSTTDGSARFDFSGVPSESGTLVYRSGGTGDELYTVKWLDRTGKTRPLLMKPGFYVRPSLSPDGSRLALAVTEGASRSIRVYDWQRDTMTRLTFGAEQNVYPTWSPDGRNVVFSGPGGMSWTRSDGAGKPQHLTQSKNPQWPWSFTPDGKRMAFQERNAGAGWDLWTVPVESDGASLRAGKPEVFLQTTYDERQPSFSPDGRWLAYSSNESGTFQIYVRAFPDKGGKWQISTNGGEQPVWSRIGRELLFRTEDGPMMVASYTVNGDSFIAGKPQTWAEKRLTIAGRNGIYDVAPDSKRIATLMPAEEEDAPQQSRNHVIFLMNFADELQRKVPVAK